MWLITIAVESGDWPDDQEFLSPDHVAVATTALGFGSHPCSDSPLVVYDQDILILCPLCLPANSVFEDIAIQAVDLSSNATVPVCGEILLD